MSTDTLSAMIRNEKGRKTRKKGFIPAAIYGKTMPSTSIKFNKKETERWLRKHGRRSRIMLDFEDEEKMGIIKEVASHPVTDEIQHLDIQIVGRDEKVNWEIPIYFQGREVLDAKRYLLQADISLLKVTGAVKDIPDAINVDVSEKEIGDVVLIGDLDLNPNIETEYTEDTVVASVRQEIVIEEEEEETEGIEGVEGVEAEEVDAADVPEIGEEEDEEEEEE